VPSTNATYEEVTPGFRLASTPYRENPGRAIARMAPSMLGLPDRDYYLSDEPRYRITRERYIQHIQRLITLAGVPISNDAATRVVEMETAFARERLSRVDLRDPYKTNTHLTVARCRAGNTA
jgi:putative endopeptidase